GHPGSRRRAPGRDPDRIRSLSGPLRDAGHRGTRGPGPDDDRGRRVPAPGDARATQRIGRPQPRDGARPQAERLGRRDARPRKSAGGHDLEGGRPMLKKILLALDGSENAEKALPWAKQLAGREKAQVVLLRVVPSQPSEIRGRDREEAREYLLRMEKELNYAGIPSKVLLRRGNPAREIVDAAEDQGCDLIVMSTRGGSP